MQLAAVTSDMDIEHWLAENTLFCFRYQARMSPDACKANRKHSGEDLRCENCGGLDDQGTKQVVRLHNLLRSENIHPLDQGGLEDPEDDEGTPDELLTVGVPEDQAEDLSCLEELEYELSDVQLEALCLGLSLEMKEILGDETLESEEWPRSDRQASRKGTTRKVAVYTGRCHRCGGYMVNSPEAQFSIRDESVYRCFTCGWRTSPGYEFNRNGIRAPKT